MYRINGEDFSQCMSFRPLSSHISACQLSPETSPCMLDLHLRHKCWHLLRKRSACFRPRSTSPATYWLYVWSYYSTTDQRGKVLLLIFSSSSLTASFLLLIFGRILLPWFLPYLGHVIWLSFVSGCGSFSVVVIFHRFRLAPYPRHACNSRLVLYYFLSWFP